MVTPMTVCPRSASIAAATAESTPPLMATRMVEGRSGMKFVMTGTLGSGGGGCGAELLDDGGDDLQHAVDLLLGATSAEAEAHRGLRNLAWDSHREKHVRGMRGACLAGGAAGDRDPLHVQGENQVLPFGAHERKVRGVGNPGRTLAVTHDARDALQERGLEPVSQSPDARPVLVQLLARQLGGLPQAHDRGNVLRPGTSSLLVLAAELERNRLEPPLHVERADSLRTVELVSGDRGEHRLPGLDVDRDLARCLDGIHVECHASSGPARTHLRP